MCVPWIWGAIVVTLKFLSPQIASYIKPYCRKCWIASRVWRMSVSAIVTRAGKDRNVSCRHSVHSKTPHAICHQDFRLILKGMGHGLSWTLLLANYEGVEFVWAPWFKTSAGMLLPRWPRRIGRGAAVIVKDAFAQRRCSLVGFAAQLNTAALFSIKQEWYGDHNVPWYFEMAKSSEFKTFTMCSNLFINKGGYPNGSDPLPGALSKQYLKLL